MSSFEQVVSASCRVTCTAIFYGVSRLRARSLLASMALTPSPPTMSVQEHIQTLTDAHGRLQALRHVPTMLLRAPLADFPAPFDPTMDREFAATFNSTPAHDFRALKDFVGVICSDKVQEALRAARASEEVDQSELGLSFLRERWKRKRPQSPVGSPQPYVPSPPRSSSLLMWGEEEGPAMRAESLLEYVHEFNRGHTGEAKVEGDDTAPLPQCRLAIWSQTTAMRDSVKGRGTLTSPVVLRFTITDVLTAYISVMFTEIEDALIVESVTAFGPREKKLPHERSDYLAFQGVTQHIAKMLMGHPRVPVQMLMGVLVSYRGLFVERCAGCGRVLSVEEHIPPVARVWVGSGGWEARHGTCTAYV